LEDRYARHRLIEGWDQKRLADAKVLVAGAGAIGNEVLKNLALLGIGHILVVDFDRIELSNLTRSVLFRAGDIGQSKARLAAERVRQINPDCDVRYIEGDLEFDVGLGVYRAMDAVIGGLDSLNARLALNRACLRAGAPWLNGGIEDTIAEVSLFGPGSGACFECGMSPMMWERRNRRYSCGGLRTDLPEDTAPTTATVASIVAGYLVHELLLLLHAGEGAPKEGLAFSQKLYLTLKPYACYAYDLPANPECLAHEVWEPVEIASLAPQRATVVDLLQYLGEPEGVVELGYELLTEMHCLECDEREAIFRPVEKCGLELTRCTRCGTATRRPETLRWLDAGSEFADKTLAALGVADYQIVAIKSDAERRYVQLTGEYTF